jgi:hypothetical protein
LFGRTVKLDRKSGVVKIRGVEFTAQKYDDAYFLRDEGRLLEALSDVRFEELPREVVIRTSPEISHTFKAFKGPSLKITRDGIIAFFSVDEQGGTLIDPVEFARELETSLRENGFNVEAGHGYSYSAKYAAEGVKVIGQVIQRLDSIISYVNHSAAEREKSLQELVDEWVSSLEDVDGRLLAGRRDIYGITRWLITPLTSQDIAYLLFYLEPPSFNLNERIAEAIVRRIVDSMNETEDRLARLGLLTIEGNILDTSWAGSALKRILDRIFTGGAVPLRQGPEPRYDPTALLHYIGRNFAPLALQMSGKLRGNRRGLRRYVEKMLRELSFIHVAVVTSIQMNIEVPKPVLDDTLETIIRLGFLSHRMKIKPFGKWLTTLTKGYIRKAGILKNQKDWENILNWHSLY